MMNGLSLIGKGDAELLAMADRREALKRLDRVCPACKSEQVQLISWYTDDLKLRCRRCKHNFVVSI
ncbi:MAG: hypothetical protein ACRC6V_19575 [Bacteroidales bacterium]